MRIGNKAGAKIGVEYMFDEFKVGENGSGRRQGRQYSLSTFCRNSLDFVDNGCRTGVFTFRTPLRKGGYPVVIVPEAVKACNCNA